MKENGGGENLASCGKTIGGMPRRILERSRLLTRPALATISPSHPASAKTAPSARDARWREQGRSELSFLRVRDYPNCLRPTRGVLDRALREHGDRPSQPANFFSILLMNACLAL